MSVAIGYMPGAFGPGGQDPHFLRQLVQVGDTYGGFDHGVGHPLLLLYDTKAPHGQNSM